LSGGGKGRKSKPNSRDTTKMKGLLEYFKRWSTLKETVLRQSTRKGMRITEEK